jgi:type II secretory pathway pseudopilin PulG
MHFLTSTQQNHVPTKENLKMKTLTPTTKNPFSMIELVIALVIIVIGVVGIIGLIPPAMDASSDTVQRSNAADAADQFLHFMAGEVKEDWSVINAFPENQTVLVSSGTDGTIESKIIFSNQSLIAGSNIDISFAAINADDVFDPTKSAHQTGVFKVKQITPANMLDFEGIITAYRVETTTNVGGSATATSVTLVAEVQWPASAPPEKRQSSTYKLQVFRPSDVAVNTAPPGYEAEGCVNINPGQSTNVDFYYTLADGSTTGIADMKAYYHANNKTNLSYNGGVKQIKFTAKSTGRDMVINGTAVQLNTGTDYTISGNIILKLSNNQPSSNSWGQAAGHWWACISGKGLTISPAPPGL